MSGAIRKGAKWTVSAIVTSFLIVSIAQVLIYFHFIGDSFPEKVLITFVSLIIATILLFIATKPGTKTVIRGI